MFHETGKEANAMRTDYAKRLALLETQKQKDLHALVTFSNGEVKRLFVADVCLAALRDEPKVAGIQWLRTPLPHEDGRLPQLAEFIMQHNNF